MSDDDYLEWSGIASRFRRMKVEPTPGHPDCDACHGEGAIQDPLQHFCSSCDYFLDPHKMPTITCPKCEGCKCDQCAIGTARMKRIDPNCKTCNGLGKIEPPPAGWRMHPVRCQDCVDRKT